MTTFSGLKGKHYVFNSLTPLQDKLDEILDKDVVINFREGSVPSIRGGTLEAKCKRNLKKLIITAIEAWVTSARPEKREEKLYGRTAALTGREWNEVLDEYHANLIASLNSDKRDIPESQEDVK